MKIEKNTIESFDPEVSKAINLEKQRQEDHIELIASENYTTPMVMEAQGSVLTNKYAEGYPGKRYYGGCEHVDTIETLAIDRAKQLFNAGYANVQPHSGSQANAAVYQALLTPGDTILGMGLPDGGHLTHGASVNFSGRLYNSISYGLNNKTHEIDYEQVATLAEEHKPKLIVAGFSAYSRVIDWQKFKEIADSIGAYFVADMAHVSGLIATGIYPSPVNIADVVTSTTHKTLMGPRGGIILAGDDPEIHKKLNFALFPGMQGGPLCHVIAAKAICFKYAMSDAFKQYQMQVVENAKAMCKTIIDRGYKVVSNGTDNHMFLVDLIGKNYTGKDAEDALGRANITLNKNSVPNEPRSPFKTSGLRIGSPAITTRGLKATEAIAVASLVCDILDALETNENITSIQQQVKDKVLAICAENSVYS